MMSNLPIDPTQPLTWGHKRRCPHSRCQSLFYDFFQTKLTCPTCGRSFTVDDTLKLRSSRLSRNEADKHEEIEDDEEDTTLEEELEDEIPSDIDPVLSESKTDPS